jgi:hypothetical protein
MLRSSGFRIHIYRLISGGFRILIHNLTVVTTITDNARTIVAAQTMSSSAKASIPHMLLLAAVALMIL